jgi:hypothetical protein
MSMTAPPRSLQFEAALAVSPSTALTYILGSVIHGWAAEAERATEWAERGLRLSPFDAWAFAAFGSLAMGHFQKGRYSQAANAAYISGDLIRRLPSDASSDII